jgi:hypothetical protein
MRKSADAYRESLRGGMGELPISAGMQLTAEIVEEIGP